MVKKLSVWQKLLIFVVTLAVSAGAVLFFVQRFQSKPSLEPITASELASKLPEVVETPSENFSNNSGSGVDAEEAGEEVEPPREVSIYIDAWSMSNIKEETLYVALPDGEIIENLVFTPLSPQELIDYAKSSPKSFASVIARLYSSDSRIECVNSTCTAGSANINPALFSNISQIPVFGKIYEDLGLTSGIFKATALLPYDTTSFIVGSANLSPYVFGLTLETEQGVGQAFPRDDNLTSFYIATAFGRVFPVAPAWMSESPLPLDKWHARSEYFLGANTNYESASLFESDPLSAGPSDHSTKTREAAEGLTAYQLTYLSSPVSGCGLSTVCSSEPVSVLRNNLATESGFVCHSSGGRAFVVINTSEWVFNLKNQNHVLGVWGDLKEPLLFNKNAEYESVLGYLGEPPLVTGDNKAYTLNIYLIDSAGLVKVESARSVLLEDIPDIKLATINNALQGEYTPC